MRTQRILLAAAALTVASPAPAQMVNRYTRAERVLAWNVDPLIIHDQVTPHWMRGGSRFWYRDKVAEGAEWVVVDPVRATKAPLFDVHRLAAALSLAADTSFAGTKLPFTDFEFTDDAETTIAFQARKKRFECHIQRYTCTVGDTIPSKVPYVKSPDGKWEAFSRDYNLWIRPAGGGDSIQLTTDGVRYWAYGTAEPRPSQIIAKMPSRPVLQWSPDSKRIVVERMDERGVPMMPLYSSTKIRPQLYQYPYPLPEDSVIPRFDIHVLDIEARSNVRVKMEPQPYLTFSVTGMVDSTWVTVKWKEGGSRMYFTHAVRGAKRIQLMEADLKTGDARFIVADSMPTHVEWTQEITGARPNWDVLNGGRDVIIFSERDGWGHLWRFDGEGKLKNQITRGPWTVGRILAGDEATGRIWFTARGRDPGRIPVMADLYTVNLDGSGLARLGGEDADHTVSATPDGRYFVDAWSRPDAPPVSVLRDRTGRVVLPLEKADVSRAVEAGWSMPEIFSYKARDGLTTVYGLLYKPSDFDSTATYPVVEYIYPGPFIGSVGLWNFNGGSLGSVLRSDQQALAELGFIVVQMDHMGTPFRSKAFLDNYYGFMGDNGLPDHITALQQMASTRPWMDLERVGIYGHSGGGFASTDALLRFPDFYKVAVSSSGNHDNRSYHAAYAEKYNNLLVRDTVKGTDNYAKSANFALAGNLKGHRLLITGDMDDNAHPVNTLWLVDALIKANKSFDLLIMTDRNHGMNEPYVIRRRWDYFVEHLRGEAPPVDFQIRQPAG
ncbi:MAG: S9 family peptidase [Gemmatimonadetes bacterium]|nr:S9 family peptidase [Gemmatimonadota bacterium]